MQPEVWHPSFRIIWVFFAPQLLKARSPRGFPRPTSCWRGAGGAETRPGPQTPCHGCGAGGLSPLFAPWGARCGCGGWRQCHDVSYPSPSHHGGAAMLAPRGGQAGVTHCPARVQGAPGAPAAPTARDVPPRMSLWGQGHGATFGVGSLGCSWLHGGATSQDPPHRGLISSSTSAFASLELPKCQQRGLGCP